MFLPRRPRRRDIAATKIARYWSERATHFDVDLANPKCFRCRRPAPSWGDFDRAHLVNRGYDGLDTEPNLAMICNVCHRIMPNFEIDEWLDAIDWVTANDNSFLLEAISAT